MPLHTLAWAPYDERCTEDADTAADEREARRAAVAAELREIGTVAA